MYKAATFLLWVLDSLLLIALFFATYALRTTFDGAIQPVSFYIPLLDASLILFLLSGLLFSLYAPQRTLFSLSYLSDFLRAFSFWAFCLLAFSFFTKTDYSRFIVLAFIIGAFMGLYAVRYLVVWLSPPVTRKSDEDVTAAAQSILTMVEITPDPLLFLESLRMGRAENIVDRGIKRLLDLICGALAIIVLLPFFPFVVYLIRKDSEGPALRVQERIGKDGKKFRIYKFRTMYMTADLYAPCPRNEEDPRVTPFGSFLRKYSIDELPQLWNVLKGDMSLVGPRPEMPFIVEKYAPWQRARLRVLPGLTGLWQILGRKDLPLEENLEYDLYYVFNQSFFLDCAIILKTVPHLILPKGAY